MEDGKNTQLADLCKRLDVDKGEVEPLPRWCKTPPLTHSCGPPRHHQVMFFDDDQRNVDLAHSVGYKYSYHCPQPFHGKQWNAIMSSFARLSSASS